MSKEDKQLVIARAENTPLLGGLMPAGSVAPAVKVVRWVSGRNATKKPSSKRARDMAKHQRKGTIGGGGANVPNPKPSQKAVIRAEKRTLRSKEN